MGSLSASTKQLQFVQHQASIILSNPTWDMVLLFLLLAAGFFYGISFGRQRVSANILYTYAAFAIATALPLDQIAAFAQIGKLFFAKSALFLALFFFLSFMLGGPRRYNFGAGGAWWQTFLLSILQVGLLMHFMLQFLPRSEFVRLAPITKTVFANPTYHIWWVLLPIVILIIFRRIDARSNGF